MVIENSKRVAVPRRESINQRPEHGRAKRMILRVSVLGSGLSRGFIIGLSSRFRLLDSDQAFLAQYICSEEISFFCENVKNLPNLAVPEDF